MPIHVFSKWPIPGFPSSRVWPGTQDPRPHGAPWGPLGPMGPKSAVAGAVNFQKNNKHLHLGIFGFQNQARQAQARPSQGWAQQASQPSQSRILGPMGPQGAPRGPHGAPRGPRGPHGAPWGPKGPHGAPWGPKGPQGAPWGPWAPWGPGPSIFRAIYFQGLLFLE